MLGRRVDVPVWSVPDDGPQDPVLAATTALEEAARLGRNVVIVDTAGRLQVDIELMVELREVRDVLQPHDTLLVVDAMTGQEAVNVATAFDEAVSLDGIVLTKIDGDARGGAALSVKEVVGKPILFVGTGEKLEDFEPFHPDRMASRILGMGDVLTLIEKAEESFDADVAQRAQEQLAKGQFTLEDFLEQMRQVRKMGPIGNIMKMLPGMPKELRNQELDEGELGRVEAIICSMTPGRAPRPVADQRLPPAADRAGERDDHHPGERPAQAVQAGPVDDEAAHRRRRQASQAAPARRAWTWRVPELSVTGPECPVGSRNH